VSPDGLRKWAESELSLLEQRALLYDGPPERWATDERARFRALIALLSPRVSVVSSEMV
jgi:hypothetical protein